MRIVYLHGRMSSPNSQKCKFLRENGHEVYAPKLKSTDWAQSVTAAREIMEKVLLYMRDSKFVQEMLSLPWTLIYRILQMRYPNYIE